MSHRSDKKEWTALVAAFLLFAAALLVVSPAEASRTTTDARSNLAPSSSLELPPLGPVEPIDPVESSPHFGFGENLGLLDPKAGPGGFVVFAVGTAQCELTYARNNPVKYVDPDGRMVCVADVCPDDQVKLIQDLNEFTGNQYTVDDQGYLQVAAYGADASPTATSFLDTVIQSEELFSVESRNASRKVDLGQFDATQNLARLDFADMAGMEFGRVDSRTFNSGAILIHEQIHGFTGMQDPSGSGGGPGPVVNLVNVMRAERGFPQRGPEYGAPRSFSGRLMFNFQQVNPRNPAKIYWVYGSSSGR